MRRASVKIFSFSSPLTNFTASAFAGAADDAAEQDEEIRTAGFFGLAQIDGAERLQTLIVFRSAIQFGVGFD